MDAKLQQWPPTHHAPPRKGRQGMTARLRATQAEVCRNIDAAKKKGLRVIAIKPDGTVIVDDGQNPHPLVPTADASNDEWVFQP